jgi:hypothetical protein
MSTRTVPNGQEASFTVRVAVLGRPFAPLLHVPWTTQCLDYDARYEDRPSAAFQAAEGTPLGEIVLLAAERLGVRPIPARERPEGWEGPEVSTDELVSLVDFYRPGDNAGVRRKPLAGLVPAVDRQGRVYRAPWKDAPLGDAVRARDEGIFPGDPLRPYLIPHPPGGGDYWFVYSWDALETTLRAAWDVAEALSVLGGTWAALAMAKKRLRSARSAVAEHSESWRERDLDPFYARQLLLTRDSWSAEQVSVLFDIPESQAEGLLYAMGWRYDTSRHDWVPGGALSRLFTDALTSGAESVETRLRASQTRTGAGRVLAILPVACVVLLTEVIRRMPGKR